MSYGFEWMPVVVLVGAFVLLMVPAFALIGLVVVALAAIAALVALARDPRLAVPACAHTASAPRGAAPVNGRLATNRYGYRTGRSVMSSPGRRSAEEMYVGPRAPEIEDRS
jgi:hypothetical protein